MRRSSCRLPQDAIVTGCALLVLLLAGCGGHAISSGRRFNWVAARVAPGFDPYAAPDPVRWSIERLLTRGLVEEDSSGAIVPAAAQRWEVTSDRLTVTFHLDSSLRFTDGRRCGSSDFRAVLVGGLNRTDHATWRWLLGAVRGADQVRAGKRVGPLGIETPDPATLVLKLAWPDSLLLHKLALPGGSAPWSDPGAPDWRKAAGRGPYRVAGSEGGRSLTLVRAAKEPPDTIHVRFLPGIGRPLAAMRARSADLVWPLPLGLVGERLPESWQVRTASARPERRLVLAMRTDLPPTTRLATRAALAHGIRRSEILRALGRAGSDRPEWLPGGGPFDFPALDAGEVAEWMQRAKLGRSFHVVLAYDGDGTGADVARLLQGEWSRLGIYLELRPLRGAMLASQLLSGGAHLALVEMQPPIGSAEGILASIVMPMRGPAVGTFRTGWRTREFDPWIEPAVPGRGRVRVTPELNVPEAQRRLEEELVTLPIAELPWVWAAREGAPRSGFHPHFGPECASPVTRGPAGR